MPNAKVVAPANPERAGRERIKALRGKKNRSAAETAELIDLLAQRVIALEERLGDGPEV